MDAVSVRFVRAALVWLVLGVLVGGLMLSDDLAPGDWRAWFTPTHGHVLFVGWFLQFAVGVAYWLLPRKRSPELPLGYRETTARGAMLVLNAGLIMRVVAEPAQRMGHDGPLTDAVLALSSLLQLLAVLVITRQLWGRVITRRPSARDSSA
jgi:hypothetical protein